MISVMRIVLSLLIFLFIPSLVFADDEANPKQFFVTGEVEVSVVPDEIIPVVGKVTKYMNLIFVKKEIDQRTEKIIDIAEKYKIEKKDIRENVIRFESWYEDLDDRDPLAKYYVSNSMVLKIKDKSKFNEILSEVLEACAGYTLNIKFRTTEFIKYKDQVRSLAYQAAIDKADKLAIELGRKVGKIHIIHEKETDQEYWGWDWKSLSNPQMGRYNDGDPSGTNGSTALVQIKISSKINLSFELE